MTLFKKLNGKAVTMLIVGAALTTGYALRILQTALEPVVRPDPFYGSDGCVLERRIALLEAEHGIVQPVHCRE